MYAKLKNKDILDITILKNITCITYVLKPILTYIA